MPVMNGYESCEAIRSLFISKPYQRPVMVASSGYIDNNVRKKTSDTGFVLTLEIPIHINTIK